jgi:hypothetical protein
MKVYDVKTVPKKNTSFSLIGICVSYHYLDTLQFMLPVNYLHFEKILLITQEDDIETIEFCKKFENVIVLLYNFTNNNKKFDKFGALNYAQKMAYTYYPDSWYLIIDSDIILPNNIIDVLNNEKLNTECIYGAMRINALKSSELLDKSDLLNNKKLINFIYNNILFSKNHPPCILGCFQLYKKKNIYHRGNIQSCEWGDYHFAHDHFTLFCNIENISYIHLGPSCKNWNGKIEGFNDDIYISLDNIFYECYKNIKNKYYNKKRQLVNTESKEINKIEKRKKMMITFFKVPPKSIHTIPSYPAFLFAKKKQNQVSIVSPFVPIRLLCKHLVP